MQRLSIHYLQFSTSIDGVILVVELLDHFEKPLVQYVCGRILRNKLQKLPNRVSNIILIVVTLLQKQAHLSQQKCHVFSGQLFLRKQVVDYSGSCSSGIRRC